MTVEKKNKMKLICMAKISFKRRKWKKIINKYYKCGRNVFVFLFVVRMNCFKTQIFNGMPIFNIEQNEKLDFQKLIKSPYLYKLWQIIKIYFR